MNITPISNSAFDIYGKAITGYELGPILNELSKTPKPDDGIIYEASCSEMESLDLFKELESTLYGGMPIQFGYCNGNNRTLNCLEFHRGSELCITADSIVLLVAPLAKMKNNSINVSEVEAFSVPAGTAVLLYETTLHYAPCNNGNDGFRTVIVLPRGTNGEKPEISPHTDDDALLWGRNKWLIAHPDAPAASKGAVAGIIGKNISLT